MGTPGRISRKCAARLHRSSQGAPCPIRTTPTDSCARSRFRAAREPRAEITGCPRDWRISSRIESKRSRNSTCTIVVIVLRNACLSEQSCAETRREDPSGWNPQFRQKPSRQSYVSNKKRTYPHPIRHFPSRLFAHSQFTQERHHWAPVGEC